MTFQNPIAFIKSLRKRRSRFMQAHYKSDGFGVRNKNIGFLNEPRFKMAWERMLEGDHGEFRSAKWMNGRVPDIRWRAHLNCWAAQTALAIEGDYVECGTATGIVAATICDFLDFSKIDKTFFLFDTFAGIPAVQGMTEQEQAFARRNNDSRYFDCFAATTANFARWPNVKLVQGVLPGSMPGGGVNKIAYLHMDLNNAIAEMETIEAIWDRITPGAPIVLDDYAFGGHEAQYEAWNDFGKEKGHLIFTLPTGQGLMLKR